MWILLHRAGGRRNHSGGNIPVELGREMCPNPWHPCPDPNQEFQICAGHESPAHCRGRDPLSATSALSPCPQGVCAWGLGPCCPGGHSAQSRIRVIFSALPFPSLAKLRREHQVQQQGHRATAFPTPLTPAGQGWRGRKTGDKVTRCDRLLCSLPVLGLVLLLTPGHPNQLSKLLLLKFYSFTTTVSPNFGPHKLSGCSSITNLGGFNSKNKPPEKAKAILQSAPYTSPANCQQSEHTSVSPSSLLSLPGSNAHENHFKKKKKNYFEHGNPLQQSCFCSKRLRNVSVFPRLPKSRL